MAESSRAVADNAASPDELLEYNKALNANVSNFVTVKLSGRENYELWRAQMMCLVNVYNMSDYLWCTDEIDKRYEMLIKGWIFGSIDQGVLKHVSHDSSTRDIFRRLLNLYGPDRTWFYDSTSLGREVTERMLMDEPPNDNESRTKLAMKLLSVTIEGSWWKAKAILKNHENAATMVINKDGDTMLHLAVREGKNYFVNQLLNFIQNGSAITIKNSKGHTALHTAVIVNNTEAAKLLVNKNEKLLDVSMSDYGQHIPLYIACISGRINTFVYLLGVTKGGMGRFDFNLGVHFLLAEITITKQYNLALTLLKEPKLLALATKDHTSLLALATDFPPELGFWEALIYPSPDGVRQNIVKRSSLLLNSFENLYIKAHNILWPAIRNLKNTNLICLEKAFYLVFIVLILLVPAVFCLIYLLIRIVIFVLLLPFFMLYPHLWKGLVYAGLPIKHIEKKKGDYDEAIKVLELICKEIKEKVSPDNYNEFYKEPILEAARADACEVVVQILRSCESAQLCTDERGHDVFQLAILNRSEKIYNCLSPGIKRSDSLRNISDGSKNRLTHLAAKLASSIVLGRTTGSALQLQRELQWHEEVKKLILPVDLTEKNGDMETSEMVFTREHANLLKEGEQWMKTTAESCSITAALIVTIVFAAAITVPGGSNQETGIPLFKKEIAFTIFALCDALSLFTAASALLVFLSILTTRFAEKDFLVSLPRRLILGLCALFISTTAMMVAFGAILFLVFCDQRPWMLAPIGLFTCMPILAIVTLQLPLLVDLFQSTYISRFN